MEQGPSVSCESAAGTLDRRLHVSSRERPRTNLGRFRFILASRLSFFGGAMRRHRHHPRKAGDLHRTRACRQQGLDAGIAGCPAGQHIVHQQHRKPAKIAPRMRADRSLKRLRPLGPTQPSERRRAPVPDQRIDHKPAPGQKGQFARQQGRLVVPTPPQPPAMQGHRHDHLIAGTRPRQPRGDHPRHHRSQCNLPPMFEAQHQLPRACIITGRRRNPAMARRLGLAGGTTHLSGLKQRHGAKIASRLAGKAQLPPTGAAQPVMPGQHRAA